MFLFIVLAYTATFPVSSTAKAAQIYGMIVCREQWATTFWQASLPCRAEHPGPCADWQNLHLLLLTLPSLIYSATWRWTCKMLIRSETFLHLSQIIFKYARVNANQTHCRLNIATCFLQVRLTSVCSIQLRSNLTQEIQCWSASQRIKSGRVTKGITAGIAVLRKEDIDKCHKWQSLQTLPVLFRTCTYAGFI